MNQSPGNSTRRTWPLITRGRLRWGIALAAVVSVWWVGTRSPLVRWVVSSRLMGITGVEMVEGSVSIGLSGHLVFEDAVLRIPAVMGTAGEVFRVRRLDAAVSWRTLLGLGGASSPSIREVLLIEPRVRVSQDRESGRLNIAGLGSLAGGAGSSGGTSGGTAGPRLIPRIQIDGGVVEIGEHGGEGSRDTYTVLKHVDVSGLLTPGSSRKDGSVEFTIREETTSISAGEKRPIKIAGTMRGGGGSLELSGIDLRQWPASNWPSRIRPVVEMLDIKGEIGRTNLTYSTGGVGAAAGIHASMELIDVAVNLPVTEDAREAWSAEKPLLRMSGVNGLIELTDSSIQASISGDVEEVPYRVRLLYEGTSADSPFRCEVHTSDFKVERGLRILRFVPPIVRERLADFSWPTGRITSTVVITRSARPEGDGDAGTPAGLRISGEMEISDAVSAFARFPYEFQDLTGKVRFSDERIDLLDIRGRSATGAVLRASGFIEPPTADSHCVIDVHVDDLRIDEAVLSALSVRRKGIAPVIFNREQHSRLVAAGLIARPGDQHAPAPTPRFGLDGLANVHTRVIRPAGPDTEWQEETAIDFDSISILPEWFPLPMVARGVEVRIGDDTMTVRGGEYIPVTGGRATADARVDYDIIINPETKGSPELTVRAEGVPANRLLHYAIGAAIDRANRDQGSSGPGPRLRGILDDLNPTGPVTGELRLFNDEHGDGRVGALIRAGPLTLRPAAAEFTPDSEALDPAGGDLEVSDVIGTVEITDRLVGFEFSGTMSGGAEAESADGSTVPGGRVRVSGESGPGADGESSLRANVVVEGIELSWPLERVVAPFSIPAAEKLSSLSREYNPSGRVGGRINVETPVGETAVTGTAEQFDEVSLSIEGRLIALHDVKGAISVNGNGDVSFREFEAEMLHDGAACGSIAINGSLHTQEGDGFPTPSLDFEARLRSARAESTLLRGLAERRMSDQNDALLKSLNPRGVFDADFEVLPGIGAGGGAGLYGVLRPGSLTVTMNETEVEFRSMTGEVTFTASNGQVRAVTGHAEGFDLRADGAWSRPGAGDLDIDLTLSGRSRALPRPLRAMLPRALRDVLDSISFDVSGDVEIGVMQLQVTESDDPSRQRLLAGGQLRLTGASLVIGLPVTEFDGELDFRVENNDFETPAGFNLRARADRLRLSGLVMQAGFVEMKGQPDTGEITIPTITADCYGGKFVGRAMVSRPGPSPREYSAEFSLSGVRFAPTLRDVTAVPGKDDTQEKVDDLDASRGLVDASIAIGGRIDQPASRRGRGSASIAGPSVLRMPLVMPLIRFSNLQMPRDEPLDLASATFYIDGPVLAFENLSVFSSSVQILGFGTMTWPETTLDLRFNSKSTRRIPVVNWLIEGIRDELVSTRVTGTLSNPEVSSTPFDSTRRFFLQVFGSNLTDHDRRMLELERESERESGR